MGKILTKQRMNMQNNLNKNKNLAVLQNILKVGMLFA